MKAKTKVILGSAMTAAMCASLIAGSTFALFTSESSVNIAVSSGKVDVVATADNLNIASTLPGEANDFKALGTATLEGNALTVSDMAPGDYVTFDLAVVNHSTVNTKWQLSVSVDSEGKELFGQLKVDITGPTDIEMVDTSLGKMSKWQELGPATGDGQTVGTFTVKISMPEEVTAQIPGECNMEVAVLAVQGNAATDDPVSGAINLHEVFDVDVLKEETEQIAQDIHLLNDIELPEKDAWEALNLSSDVTFFGHGHTISFKEGDPEQLAAEAGTAVKDVTLRLSTDFGKRCTWDDEGTMSKAWQVNNENGFTTLAKNVEGVETISVHSLIATIADPVPQTYQGEVIELTQDVDLNGKEWTPIGKMGGTLFMGTFDGKGHTIRNLTYTTAQSGAGLFNSTNDAQYKNIHLENITVTGTEYVGALVGYGYTSDYQNVTATNVTLTGNHYMGGIAGGSYSSFVNCHVEHLVITCTPDGEAGNYDNGDKVGGLTGIQESGNFQMENCSVIDAKLTAFRDVGGFVGYSNAGHVTNSVLENVHITIDRTKNYSEADPKEINADSYIGRKSEGCTVDEGSAAAVKDFTIEYVNCGLMEMKGGVYIYAADGLKALREKVNSGTSYAGKTVYLMADIDLAGMEWTPIGTSSSPFVGTFDGNGHTVTYHIQVSDPEPGYYGLFGCVKDQVTIENLTVAGSVIMTRQAGEAISGSPMRIGGIVGGLGMQSKPIIKKCISLVNFDFSKLITHRAVGGYPMYFGGIIGDASSATLENLVFAGSVALNENAYEEDGKAYPGIQQWSQASSNIGGIVGNVGSSVSITHCLNLGQTKYFKGSQGGATAGGIVGRYVSTGSTIAECYSLTIRCIGYDAGKTSTGAPGEDDAIKETLTAENWSSKCVGLQTAGWEWSNTFKCPVPTLNA